MKVQTLFRAYRLAVRQQEYAVQARGRVFGRGSFGIACGEDEQSIRWQRYERLARRITARIEGYEVCPSCAYPRCFCDPYNAGQVSKKYKSLFVRGKRSER